MQSFRSRLRTKAVAKIGHSPWTYRLPSGGLPRLLSPILANVDHPPFIPKVTALAARQAAVEPAQRRAAMIREVQAIFAGKELARTAFQDRYGFARPPMATKMGDKWVIAIGNSIYKQTRDGGYNFVNALHDHALAFFGEAFIGAEEAKPFESRHPAIQWLDTVVAVDEQHYKENEGPRGYGVGAGAAWGRFSYDLYTIADNSELQASLRKRLLSGRDWQGARHELRVAALCVVAGFELKYEDESDGSRTHPEFVATDKRSGIRVAVEAKSRHRHGVQGFQGGKQIEPGETVEIRSLVLDAYKKATDLPLYVFVDTNLPPGDLDDRGKWMVEMEQTMNDLAHEGYTNPCPANAIFFTNDPSHYLGESKIGSAEDRLWIRNFTAELPRVAHPLDDIVARFMRAHDQRLAPPQDFVSFN